MAAVTVALLLWVGDIDARVQRDARAVAAFKKAHPCPATGAHRGACPGWVIDHVHALACGGLDHQSNMQWQTVAAAKEKDRWERQGCPRKSRLK